jgi:ankyrin repeat protein
VDLGYTKEAGWTALCYAIETGRKDVAELLMAAGATMTGTGRRRGQTLLMYAVQRRDPDVTKLLLEHTGPQGINETDHLGRTALHMACEGNRVEVIKVLLLAGADYKMRDLTGRTPLDTINHGRQQTPDQRCIRLLNVKTTHLSAAHALHLSTLRC